MVRPVKLPTRWIALDQGGGGPAGQA